MKKICPACNNWFEAKKSTTTFCSHSCWIDSRVWYDTRDQWYAAQGIEKPETQQNEGDNDNGN